MVDTSESTTASQLSLNLLSSFPSSLPPSLPTYLQQALQVPLLRLAQVGCSQSLPYFHPLLDGDGPTPVVGAAREGLGEGGREEGKGGVGAAALVPGEVEGEDVG